MKSLNSFPNAIQNSNPISMPINIDRKAKALNETSEWKKTRLSHCFTSFSPQLHRWFSSFGARFIVQSSRLAPHEFQFAHANRAESVYNPNLDWLVEWTVKGQRRVDKRIRQSRLIKKNQNSILKNFIRAFPESKSFHSKLKET